MFTSHDITENKKIIGCICVVIALGIILLIMDYLDTQKNFAGTITRNNTVEGSFSQKLLFEAGEYADDIEITIESVRITEEEAKELFEEAKREIDTKSLGDNESADYVLTDLKFDEMYANGLVEARWVLDNYEIVNPSGVIIEENTTADGKLINAMVYLTCGAYQEIYDIAYMIYEPPVGSYAKFLKSLKAELSSRLEDSAEENLVALPESAEEINIIWKKPMDYRGLHLIILAFVSGVAILIGQRQDTKKEEKLIMEAKTKDYPEIVSTLSILMGAGISFKGALERMCKRYIRRRKKSGVRLEGYEELLKTYNEMRDGVGELDAIERLGSRSGCKEYRKLSMLLSQNLRKGSRELIDMLEKEEAYAFELRKQIALKAGEEASTRMLVPMLGMLGIVVVILIVPATMQMNL